MQASSGQSNNRMVLLLIAGIPVTMILAATWLWFFVARGDIDLVGMLGTANQGALVQPPRPLAEAVSPETGERIEFSGTEPRWTLLVANDGERCGRQCEATLYLTRQIHLAMGKEFNRLQRMYVGDQPVADTELAVSSLSDGRPLPGSFTSYLEVEQKGLAALQLSTQDFQRLFVELGQHDGTWYLVDPAGWIMMSYDASVSYKDVMSDLKFLLKNSNE